MSILRYAFLLLASCVLAACASVGNVSSLKPGVSTEADAARVAHRKPGYVWENKDGTRTLEFSNQPYEGFDCFMVTVDAKSVVQKIEQVDTEANRARVVKGLSRDEVRRLLGEARSVQRFPLSGEEVWDWNASTDIDAIIRFNVHFINGNVVRTSTRRADAGTCVIGCG